MENMYIFIIGILHKDKGILSITENAFIFIVNDERGIRF